MLVSCCLVVDFRVLSTMSSAEESSDTERDVEQLRRNCSYVFLNLRHSSERNREKT